MTGVQAPTYIISGGKQGRERLGLLARVLEPTTSALLDRFEPLEGATVVDAGCGGGDVSFELARRVGPRGRVIGYDLDEVKLGLAREQAERQGLRHVEFQRLNVLDPWPVEGASLAYARFVLTHLPDPAALVARAKAALAPNGVFVVEDIDYKGEFCDPPCEAFTRYSELYVKVAKQRGANPYIGPTLPRLLEAGGFGSADASLVQPMARQGDPKYASLLTLTAIKDAAIQTGCATASELASLTAEITAYIERSDTLVAWPRIFQAWGVNGAAATA